MPIRTIGTHRLDEVTEPIPHPSWGEYLLQPDTYFLLHIGMDRHQLLVPRRKEIFIGRADEQGERMPDIDLVPYEGIEHGVSRLHARFNTNYNQLTVTDLSSSNGTYLNGMKLDAHKPSLVRAGDDIRFGKLIVYVYFMRLSNRIKPEDNS
jgi:pSer/pThr/pTyr-binding forkhead associated (FHA) protein